MSEKSMSFLAHLGLQLGSGVKTPSKQEQQVLAEAERIEEEQDTRNKLLVGYQKVSKIVNENLDKALSDMGLGKLDFGQYFSERVLRKEGSDVSTADLTKAASN